MAVKRSGSALRVLAVFEAVAQAQPIGVSALARRIGADKSAVQRDLMTLADAGWIAPAPGSAGQWELTPHVLTLVRQPHSGQALRRRAKPVMERLREDSGETVYLTVPHQDAFVVIEAVESRHVLRMVPPLGMPVPARISATARAFAGGPHVATRGYAVSDGDIVPGSVTLAAAIRDDGGAPLAALVVTGPAERMGEDRRAVLGEALRRAAEGLSAPA